MRSSRKIPPPHAHRLGDIYPPSKTVAGIPGISPPGSVKDFSRCQHHIKVHDCSRQVSICVQCGLPSFGALKLRTSPLRRV